jgi:hypothetical protein
MPPASLSTLAVIIPGPMMDRNRTILMNHGLLKYRVMTR